MTTTTVLGRVVLGCALGLTTGLILWSRRTIDRIADSKSRSAREILRELRGDR